MTLSQFCVLSSPVVFIFHLFSCCSYQLVLIVIPLPLRHFAYNFFSWRKKEQILCIAPSSLAFLWLFRLYYQVEPGVESEHKTPDINSLDIPQVLIRQGFWKNVFKHKIVELVLIKRMKPILHKHDKSVCLKLISLFVAKAVFTGYKMGTLVRNRCINW